MPRVGFEPTISAGERPKIYALDRAVTRTGGVLIKRDVLVEEQGQFDLSFWLQMKLFQKQ